MYYYKLFLCLFIPSCWTVGAEWGGVFNFGTVRFLDE